MYNLAALFLNHKPSTAGHHYDLNPEVVMQASLFDPISFSFNLHAERRQAQQMVCQEYHNFVLDHITELVVSQQELAGNGAVRVRDEAVEDESGILNEYSEAGNNEGGEVHDDANYGQDPIDIDDNSWNLVAQRLGIQSFRPLQKQSLDIINRAVITSQTDKKLTTVGIVTPTSSGKDMLPLALAVFRRQVSVMFVPFKHLYDKTYADNVGCVSEVFRTGVENTAANLLMCAYENSALVNSLLDLIFF